ncbi:probable disease resistance protein At1g59620 [Magnolia sinica]|uniref:probable disease resistance protein At1g59620 n=1 Tax=Magnolia sinica TaxID=86752 RepID=UPI0026589C6A|nr:probable disease resistance protein At1g59620 [Magnolia sinica]
MADDLLQYMLEKVISVIKQEAGFQEGLTKKVEELKWELDSMRSFLEDADRMKDMDQRRKTWVKQVREVTNAVEEIINDYTRQMQRKKNRGFKGFIFNPIHLAGKIIFRHRLVARLKEIIMRIKNIDERNRRYVIDKVDEGKSLYDARILLGLMLGISSALLLGVSSVFVLVLPLTRQNPCLRCDSKKK